MTAEELLKIDIEIARQIFGWEYQVHKGKCYYGKVIFPDMDPFSPTINITTAWEVVEKIRNTANAENVSLWYFDLKDRVLAPQWEATFLYRDVGLLQFAGQADTAPLAICLAALEVVSYVKEDGEKVFP